MLDGVDVAHEALGAVKVLPEAAQLEMIRGAALPSEIGTGLVRLTDVAWHDVVVVDGRRHVHVDMRSADEGHEWILHSDGGDTGSTGYVAVLPDTEPERLDLDGWRRCSLDSERTGLLELRGRKATVDSGADSVLLPAQLTDCLAILSEHFGWDQHAIRFLDAREVAFTIATGREAALAAVRLGSDISGDVASLDIDLLNHEGTSLVGFRGLRITVSNEMDDPAESSTVGVGAAPGPGRRSWMVGWPVAECVAWELRDVVSEVLKLPVEKLDDEVSFQDLGFDSIRLVEFAGVLGERLRVELMPDVFFSYPTLSELGVFLLEEHGESVGAVYHEGTGTGTSARRGRLPERSGRVPARRWMGRAAAAGPEGGVEPVAVVGMSGRFPGARSVEELWAVLSEGRCVVGEIPLDRGEAWRDGGRWLGVVPGVAEFDPLFFEISPREAELMDPRQRLLLQEMWLALEDAGYGPDRIAGERVGIFVGAEEGDYRNFVGHEASLTSNNTSVLAARLAYFLDLSGPSMSINTSCSSGLVALHEACLSLRSGECDTAIVAGVNVLSDPGSYDAMAEAGMLSPDGVCYAFDQRANGMVPGEAAVALVLKREYAASESGCRVYGSVLGSGVNYDGKTNGITAPSGAAQRRLLTDVYQRCGVAPESVGYVVAHGTGTRLGDPVEINALADAFGAATDRVGFCALTSVKPNVGHTQAASGLVSVVALLQAMRHEVVPPSVHCEQLSDYIRWDDSPFFVNRESLPWPEDPRRPRRGGVSSFGFSGTNAHVLVQAGTTVASEQHTVTQRTQPAYLVPVSAKNPNALTRVLAELADFLEQRDDAVSLTSVSRTLTTARHHFSHRCALVVHSREDAVRQLRLAAEGKKAPTIHSGVVARDFAPNGLMQELAGGALGARDNIDRYQESLDALAGLYCQGYQPAVHDLFDGSPTHISIPGYPFARDEYWIAPAVERRYTTSPARLHPLVHENTSDLTEQAYTSVFTDSDRFVVTSTGGETILSPAAHLEMAHEAVRRATPVTRADEQIVRLRDVHWYHPIAVGESGVRVRTALIPERTGDIVFEITSGDDADTLIHSRGYAFLDKLEPTAIDLPALRGACTRTVGDVQAGTDVLVADLPDSTRDSSSGLVTSPQAVEAALRATTVLGGEPGQLRAPASVERVEIFDSCGESAVSVVRRTAADTYDIDVCDESGRVSFRISGLTVDLAPQETAGSTVTRVLEAVWEESAPPAGAGDDRSRWPEWHVLFCDSDAAAAKDAFGGDVRVHGLSGSGPDIASRYTALAEQLFAHVRDILRSKPKHEVLVQVVTETELDLYSGLSGLLRTVRLENPKVTAQLIGTDSPADSADTIARIEAEARTGRAAPVHVRYVDGERFLPAWRTLPEWVAPTPPWRADGTYLITGGTGGLGLLFAREIAERAPGARIVLTGRSAPDERTATAVEGVRQRGARTEYVQLDVTDLDAVTEAVGAIAATGDSLRGIVHCAGVLRDGYIVRKDVRDVHEVLAPKVTGLVNLDQATAETSLDFLVCFASSSGSVGNAGQSDYALGNAFMDGFAVHRNAQVAAGARHGRTLAVDWGLWQDGGMAMNEDAVARMEQQSGIVPIPSRAGIDAFYRSVVSAAGQTLCLSFSDERRFQQSLTERLAVASGATSTDAVVGADSSRTDKPLSEDVLSHLVGHLANAMAVVLKLPVDWIDAEASFDQYGLDSISVVRLTELLERDFGTLPKTLFFEYGSLLELSEYLVDSYPAEVERLAAGEGGDSSVAARPTADSGERRSTAAMPVSLGARRSSHTRFLSEAVTAGRGSTGPLDIAIIGLSGRYPDAADVDAFWANLVQGRDSVTEIPLERWDYRAYYYDDGASKNGRISCRWGGFLEKVDRFDPVFFNIAPRDAETMDPQERLFLECAYETIQDAGYAPGDLDGGSGVNGQAGVFVGVTTADYQHFGLEQQASGTPLAINGNFSSIANRVSFAFDLHGPSLAVDTMCSSSLTAVALACDSLRLGNCDVAIAGGVNLSLHPNKYLLISQGKFTSDNGRCAAFGDGGDGYVPSEGVGAVLLKPLEQAVRDRDHIYGVIKGAAINHGGSTNGFTVPNPNAQGSVIAKALQRSGVDQRAIGYIEAHGTGTRLGDPIEIRGLSQAFDQVTDRESCAIGSVKSNIGHAEAAAGIAGLTKILLQMRHGTIVPSLHSEVPNPYIDFVGTPFVVQQETSEWSRPVLDSGGHSYEHPRVAALSSFGAGGSNGHLVVEEYQTPDGTPSDDASRAASGEVAIVLSAKTKEQLEQSAERLLVALRGGRYTEKDLPMIAYTSQVGRETMIHRMGFLAKDLDQAVARLSAYVCGTATAGDIAVGCARSAAEQPAVQLKDVDDRIDFWLAESKLDALLDSWVRGGDVDWHRLYADMPNVPGRISLPTYPFADETYWVPAATDNGMPAQGSPGRLHPLVHENTSDLRGLRFTSTFSEPAAVSSPFGQLEMARAALLLSSPDTAKPVLPVRLRQVGWHALPGKKTNHVMHVALTSESEDEVQWSIYADSDSESASGPDTNEIVFSAGTATVLTLPATDQVDVASMRAECVLPVDGVAGALTDGRGRMLIDLSTHEDGQRVENEYGFAQLRAMETSVDTARVCLSSIPEQARVLAVDEVVLALPEERAEWAVADALDLSNEGVLLNLDLCTGDGTIVARARDITFDSVAESGEHDGSALDASGTSLAPGPGRRGWMVGWSVGECVRWELRDVVSGVLKLPVEKMDVGVSFQDLGFDSIRLVEFAGVLCERLGMELTPDVFFSYPSLKELESFLLEDHGETVEVLYQAGDGTASGGVRGSARESLQRVPARGWKVPVGGIATESESEPEPEPVAIVGMSGRFPGARSVEKLWEVVSDGRCVVGEIPADRGDDWAGADRWLGAVSGVAEFDPWFFEISPREAELMDPRQRLLLQEMWRALEDAGYGSDRLEKDRVGIFVGAEEGDYRYSVGRNASLTSNNTSVLAARLAYFLDLSGPTLSINTSCSSGLVALHEACLSLRSGECDTAVVAGVNVLCDPGSYDAMVEAGMLSPDGVCYAFDQRANGMVPGEAVAVVVLRREQAAVQDGCRVYGSVLGSGVNYDGRTNGITAPSGVAQRRLLEDVFRRSGVSADSIGCVVAHGTGTRLGDPVEVNALVDAFRAGTDEVKFCALTSVKPNVGHTQAASGLVSLIVLMQAMRHEVVPPSINCDQLSDYVRWNESPFFVNRESLPWQEDSHRPRRGGVSSFGFSGTNAHVLVQAGKTVAAERNTITKQPAQPAYLLPVSAKNPNALTRALTELAGFLQSHPVDDTPGYLASVSYTLISARHHFTHRCVLVVHGHEDAVRQLRLAAEGKSTPSIHSGVVARDFTPSDATAEVSRELASQAQNSRHDPDRYGELLDALAHLYCQGHDVVEHDLFDVTPSQVSLPGYPFESKEFWIGMYHKRIGSSDAKLLANAQDELPRGGSISATPLGRDVTGAVRLLPVADVAVAMNRASEPAPGTSHRKTVSPMQSMQVVESVDEDSGVGDGGLVAPVGASDELVDRLRVSLAEALFASVEDIDAESSFTELGLDSIVGVEWVRTLNQEFDTSIAMTKIYQYPNLQLLAGYLAGEVPVAERVERAVQSVPDSGVGDGGLVAPVGASDELVDRLRVSLAEALFASVEDIDAESSFTELGLDSIVGVEWVRTLNQEFDTSIAMTKIYQYPNLQLLAGYLAGEVSSGATDDLNRVLTAVYDGDLDVGQAQTELHALAAEAQR